MPFMVIEAPVSRADCDSSEALALWMPRKGDSQTEPPPIQFVIWPDQRQGNRSLMYAASVCLVLKVQGFGAALGVVDQGTASILRAVRGYQHQSVILRCSSFISMAFLFSLPASIRTMEDIQGRGVTP